MNVLFHGNDIEECLNAAEFELGIKKEYLEYRVIKKRGIFSRKTTIEVKYKLKFENEKQTVEPGKESEKVVDDDELLKEIDKVETGIMVKDGHIKIISNSLDTEIFTIKTCKGIDLYINDLKCNMGMAYNVTEFDDLRYVEEKIDSQKSFQFRVSEDKMKVYAKIIYKPEYVYKLIDREVTNEMILKSKRVQTKEIEKYSADDIIEQLKNNKIINGIIYDKICELCESGSKDEVLIVRGMKAEDDIPDEIDLHFELEEKTIFGDNNHDETVDYKNIKSISNVKEGEIIAKIIPGKIGKNGINIYGNEVKRVIARNKPIKAGNGCKIEGDKIISTKQGRPSMSNGLFSIISTYTVRNVDLKSGNIKFFGDVEVSESIEEGMEVACQGMLIVHKDITSAKAIAKGNIITRNIIQSNIIAGGHDAQKLSYLESLNNFFDEIRVLISTIEKMNQKAPNKKIGELFKNLIEQRHKKIP